MNRRPRRKGIGDNGSQTSPSAEDHQTFVATPEGDQRRVSSGAPFLACFSSSPDHISSKPKSHPPQVSSMANQQPDLSDYYGAVRNQLRRNTEISHLADDITQEAYLRAYRHINARGPPRHPLSWLLTIARNVAHDYQRHNYSGRPARDDPGRLERMLEQERLSTADVVAENEEVEHSANAIREAVASLPDKDRFLVEGYYFNGTGSAFLAKKAGIPRPHVRVQLSRARDRLRRYLRQGGHGHE